MRRWVALREREREKKKTKDGVEREREATVCVLVEGILSLFGGKIIKGGV